MAGAVGKCESRCFLEGTRSYTLYTAVEARKKTTDRVRHINQTGNGGGDSLVPTTFSMLPSCEIGLTQINRISVQIFTESSHALGSLNMVSVCVWNRLPYLLRNRLCHHVSDDSRILLLAGSITNQVACEAAGNKSPLGS